MRQEILTSYSDVHDRLVEYFGVPFAFDVETTGLSYVKDRLLGLALTFEGGDSFYVALAHTEKVETRHETASWVPGISEIPIDTSPELHTSFPLTTYISEDDFANVVRGLFAQRDVLMVGHHSKFDLHFLSRVGLTVEGKLFDTLLAAHLINENRSVSLKNLAPLELDMPMVRYQDLVQYPGFPKDSILGVPLKDAAEYAMRDTAATYELYLLFRDRLVDEGVEEAFNEGWMPLVITLQQMEARGIALDLDLVREVKTDYEARAVIHDEALWREGIDMLFARYDDLTQVPANYLRMATADEIAEAEEQDGCVEIHGVVLPLVIPTPRSKPRVPHFKTGSNDHIGELLFDYLKLTPPKDLRLKKKANGDPSGNRDTLESIRFYLGDQAPAALKHILDLRKATKFVSTYCDRFLEDADPTDHDCIRTSFNMAAGDNDKGGTVTGRLSSNGPNLMNIPSRGEEGKQARRMFVARPGYDLIVADYGQAELRMLAHYSNDPVLTAAFVEGRDLHLQTGAGFANIPYEELKARYEASDDEAQRLRMLGKVANFALVYGMGARKFQVYLLVNAGIKVTVEEAQRLIDRFNATYAGATTWKARVIRFIHRNGYVQTLEGGKRRLPEIWSDDKYSVMYAERQGVNAAIQGSVGAMIRKAMPKIQRVFAPLGATLLLQVHDELVGEAPEGISDLCASLMADLMVRDVNTILRVPQAATAHVAKSWGAAKG